MKKVDTSVRDYVSKLSFDNLKYLAERFNNRIGSDLSECADFISKSSDMDRLLGAAKNSEEFFAVLDSVAVAIEREFSRRIPDSVSHG
jgi:hypothetical protein